VSSFQNLPFPWLLKAIPNLLTKRAGRAHDLNPGAGSQAPPTLVPLTNSILVALGRLEGVAHKEFFSASK
jgi:hypothetical protein